MATSGQPASASTAAKKELGKEDFLKLLVAQLSHQDPLQPTEGAEFVAQLAQFSNLEQSIAANQTLSSLETLQRSQYGAQAIGLIGHNVTAKADTVSVTSFGAEPINFTLAGN